MAAHTPGPWYATEQIDRIYEGNIIRAGDPKTGTYVAIACDFNRYDRDAEREANARLIAAAPDLLAACTDVADWIDQLLGDALAQGVAYSADELALALATVKDRLRAAAAGPTGTRLLP